MEVINGKWVNEFGERLTIFEAAKIKTLGKKVETVFGKKNITHERIQIINKLCNADATSERVVSNVLNNNELMSKLAGL
jgi:hypothetical protein